MIKIKTEKVVDGHGNECYRIKDIKALERKDLPEIYWQEGYPYCLLDHQMNEPSQLCIFSKDKSTYLKVGSCKRVKVLEEIIEKVHECGNRLKVINDQLREMRKAWNGTETFVI